MPNETSDPVMVPRPILIDEVDRIMEFVDEEAQETQEPEAPAHSN